MKKVKKILAVVLGVMLMTASLQGMAFAAPAGTGEDAASFLAEAGKTVAVSAAEMDAAGTGTVSEDELEEGEYIFAESSGIESGNEEGLQETDAEKDAEEMSEQQVDPLAVEAGEGMPEEAEESAQEEEAPEALEQEADTQQAPEADGQETAEESAQEESVQAEDVPELEAVETADIEDPASEASEQETEIAEEEEEEAAVTEEPSPEEFLREQTDAEADEQELVDAGYAGPEMPVRDESGQEAAEEVINAADQEAVAAAMQEQADGSLITEPAEAETVSGDAMMADGEETANTPKIAMTYVTACGINLPIQGYIYTEDGSDFNPSDYRITIYLQVSEGGNYYVKPTNATPYVDISEDGFFSAKFISGGNDITAKVLHFLLIPSSHTPSGSSRAAFDQSMAVALDYVKVTRTEDGDFTLSIPERYHDPQAGVTNYLPVSSGKLAVNVGFYTDGSSPGSALSETLIRQQLEIVKGFSDTVRFYSSGGELEKAYPIAHSMGFSVVGTAWLCGRTSEDQAELDALIRNCNQGYVQVACVGSEVLRRNQMTPQKLIGYIQYVRSRLTDDSIPVTTADIYNILLDNRAVINECDVVMPNCYPYWEKKSISVAFKTYEQCIACLHGACPGKQLIISETGWPTAGQAQSSAVPGEAESAQFFEEIREWSLSTGTQMLWFDAADEPWKRTEEGEAGAHWGLLTTDFALKSGYAETSFFREIASQTVDIRNAQVTGMVSKTYTGEAITQTPVVKLGSFTLQEGRDYTLIYRNNINVGQATMTIKAIGKDGLGRKYTGAFTKAFSIKKAAQPMTAKASKSSVAVGKTCTVNVTGAQGTVSYKSSDTSIATVGSTTGLVTAKKVGTVTITVTSTATENYAAATRNVVIKVVPVATASLTAESLVTGIRLTWEPVNDATGYRIYRDGTQVKRISGGSVVTWFDKDANSNGTEYTYKIVAEAETGLSTLSRLRVTCFLSKPAITSALNSAAGQLKVQWEKNAMGTGYQLQYSLTSDFTTGRKTLTLTGASTGSTVISSLTKGKIYYLRVRTYKTVSGKNYYSAWSAVKSVKITK